MQNFLGEGRALIANKRSIVGTIGGDGEPTCRFVQVASVVAASTFPAGVLGHYFVFGQKPLITLPGKPMRAVFKEADDAAIVAYKQTGNTTYLSAVSLLRLTCYNFTSFFRAKRQRSSTWYPTSACQYST